jgi:hypothetical protein
MWPLLLIPAALVTAAVVIAKSRKGPALSAAATTPPRVYCIKMNGRVIASNAPESDFPSVGDHDSPPGHAPEWPLGTEFKVDLTRMPGNLPTPAGGMFFRIMGAGFNLADQDYRYLLHAYLGDKEQDLYSGCPADWIRAAVKDGRLTPTGTTYQIIVPATATAAAVGFRWNDAVGLKFDTKNLVYDPVTGEPRPKIWWEKGWGITDLWKDFAKPLAEKIINHFTKDKGGAILEQADQAAFEDNRKKLHESNETVIQLTNTQPLQTIAAFFIHDALKVAQEDAAKQGVSLAGDWTIDRALRFLMARKWDGNHRAYHLGALLALACYKYGLAAFQAACEAKPLNLLPDGLKPEQVDALMQLLATKGAAFLTGHPNREQEILAPPTAAPVPGAAAVGFHFGGDTVSIKDGPKDLIYDVISAEPRPKLDWSHGFEFTDLWKDVAKPVASAVLNYYTAGKGGKVLDAVDKAAFKDARGKLHASNSAVVELVNKTPNLQVLANFFLNDTLQVAQEDVMKTGVPLTGDWTIDRAIRFCISHKWDGAHNAYHTGALLVLITYKYGLAAFVAGYRNKEPHLSHTYTKPEDIDALMRIIQDAGAAFVAAHPNREQEATVAPKEKVKLVEKADVVKSVDLKADTSPKGETDAAAQAAQKKANAGPSGPQWAAADLAKPSATGALPPVSPRLREAAIGDEPDPRVQLLTLARSGALGPLLALAANYERPGEALLLLMRAGLVRPTFMPIIDRLLVKAIAQVAANETQDAVRDLSRIATMAQQGDPAAATVFTRYQALADAAMGG